MAIRILLGELEAKVISDKELENTRVAQAVARLAEHLANPPIGVSCWKCGEVNAIRRDWVQFECSDCNATNYARNGAWPDA